MGGTNSLAGFIVDEDDTKRLLNASLTPAKAPSEVSGSAVMAICVLSFAKRLTVVESSELKELKRLVLIARRSFCPLDAAVGAAPDIAVCVNIGDTSSTSLIVSFVPG